MNHSTAVRGIPALASGNKIAYDAAVLAGVNGAAPDTTLRFEIEYEMY